MRKELKVITRIHRCEPIRKISRDMALDRKTVRRIKQRYEENIQVLNCYKYYNDKPKKFIA